MQLKVEVTTEGLCAVLKLSGRIMLGDESQLLRDTAKSIIATGQPRLIIDVSDVTYIDSAGIGTIYTSMWVWTKNAGGEVVIVNPQKKILELLQITKLMTVAPIFTSTSEAIEYFKKKATRPPTQAGNA